MKYDLAWVIQQTQQETPRKYLYFWGHQPLKDGTIGKTCLSQWWLSEFTVDGITYRSAEHWMMAEKARLFNDSVTLEKILFSKSPAEAKKLGRQVQNFEHDVWASSCYDIVLQGNIHKFGQDEALKNYLLNTQSRILVEASPYDAIWGIGMAQDHPEISFPEKWRGTNLLGFALMETRDNLIN